MNEPIPSKAFEIWSRLYGRFTLEPNPVTGSRAGLWPTIQPVTDADRLLRAPTLRREVVQATGVGSLKMVTVPDGERWGVSFTRAVKASGTFTHNEFIVVDPAGNTMLINPYTATAGSELKEWATEMVLDQGWSLNVNIDTHSVNGNLQMDLLYELEQAF